MTSHRVHLSLSKDQELFCTVRTIQYLKCLKHRAMERAVLHPNQFYQLVKAVKCVWALGRGESGIVASLSVEGGLGGNNNHVTVCKSCRVTVSRGWPGWEH